MPDDTIVSASCHHDSGILQVSFNLDGAGEPRLSLFIGGIGPASIFTTADGAERIARALIDAAADLRKLTADPADSEKNKAA